ncbi:MAG: OmpA family protein [Bacteroidetes bacterium]|nr:OmpA family protein [Bacteroidota bacterium]
MRLLSTLLFCFFFGTVYCQHRISTEIYFDFDQPVPQEASVQALHQFITKLGKQQVVSVQIEGHTDISGSNQYNTRLSKARTEAVQKILATYFPASIINSHYKGEEIPVTQELEKQAINRRVVVTILYNDEPAKPAIQLQPFLEDVELQRYSVNLDDTVFIKAKEGTTLKISPGSMQDQQGRPVTGKAEIHIREYYQPGDIIRSGLTTTSPQGLLQTGGMFRMLVIKDGDTLSSKTLKKVEMKMPAAASLYGDMNVYTANTPGSHGVWDRSGDVFIRTYGVWQWPQLKDGKLAELVIPEIRFENWKTGHKYTDEYEAHESNWHLLDIQIGNRSELRHVTNTIEKIDSMTLRSTVKVTLRKRGVKKYGQRMFDTSFYVKYFPAQYIATTGNLNWINCDRLLKFTNTTELYVSTPDYEGANVIVYLSSLRAYLPLSMLSGSNYMAPRIPTGEKIWLIALGRKGDDYFMAKKEYTVSANLKAKLELQPLPEEAFRKALKQL